MESLEERRVLTGTVGIFAVSGIAEGDGPTTAFRLDYAGDSAGSVTLPYSGTAMQGMDFTGPLFVDFPSGSGSVPIVLTAMDDALVEVEETISIMLTSMHVPPGYTITNASATIALVDNDTSSPLRHGLGASDRFKRFRNRTRHRHVPDHPNR